MPQKLNPGDKVKVTHSIYSAVEPGDEGVVDSYEKDGVAVLLTKDFKFPGYKEGTKTTRVYWFLHHEIAKS